MRDQGSSCPDLGMVMLRSVDPHAGPTMVCMVGGGLHIRSWAQLYSSFGSNMRGLAILGVGFFYHALHSLGLHSPMWDSFWTPFDGCYLLWRQAASHTARTPSEKVSCPVKCLPFCPGHIQVTHVGPESWEEKEAFFKPLRELGPVQVLCQGH